MMTNLKKKYMWLNVYRTDQTIENTILRPTKDDSQRDATNLKKC